VSASEKKTRPSAHLRGGAAAGGVEELRQKGKEEKRHLRVEQIDERALQIDARERDAWAGAVRSGRLLRAQRADAEADQVCGPRRT
jgi:hypothetical protein